MPRHVWPFRPDRRGPEQRLAGCVTLAAKVAFLKSRAAYGREQDAVGFRETHMSWVFSTGDEVYKLKKPVRFAYLDFSSLAQRHAACTAELALNRRLAPDVYKRITPLTRRNGALAIDGPGEVIDWLVVMRRLDEDHTLESLLLAHRLTPRQLDPLIAVLARFYRRAPRIAIAPGAYVARWRQSLGVNRRILLDPRLGLPAPLVRRVDRWQADFLRRRADLVGERARRRLIVDGHGDLRPERIWPEPPVRIIDCLEFNADLRAVDPLDELAFLYVECGRLGGGEHGAYIVRRLADALPGGSPRALRLLLFLPGDVARPAGDRPPARGQAKVAGEMATACAGLPAGRRRRLAASGHERGRSPCLITACCSPISTS